jgi:hypothetical protein
MRLRCWVVVDMEHRPFPVIVEASASRDWCEEEAKERNRQSFRRRFRVFTASTEVAAR